MQKRTSTALWITAIGALLGGLLATWLAPKGIAWYFDPPAQFGINCRPPIEWALKRLQWAQLTGIVTGGIGGLVIFFLVRRKDEPEQEPPIP